MTNDEPPKNDKLRLVADNDPAHISERQKQAAADNARNRAAASLATLVTNMLRVLAGAGQPHAVAGDLLKTSEQYRDAYDAGNRGQMPGLEELTLYELFREEKDEPRTEEEWRRWAADDPYRDYQEERDSLLQQLRRHILREIASTITRSDLQIRREQQEIDDVLRRLEQARKNYFEGPRKTPSQYRQRIAAANAVSKASDRKPSRGSKQEIADREIDNLHIRKRDEMIAGLQPHQWVALYAVQSGETRAFEATDSFTFDVLSRMKLLERKPGSGRSKRDWQLTELGALAMSRAPHSILETLKQ